MGGAAPGTGVDILAAMMERARRVRRGVLAAAVVVGAALTAGGCFTYRSGSGERGSLAVEPLDEEAWPARDIAAVEPFREATPAEVYRFERRPGWPEERLSPEAAEAARTPAYRVVYNQVTGRGLLRVYEEVGAGEDAAELELIMRGFVKRAEFLSEWRVRSAAFQAELERERRRRRRPPHGGLREVRRERPIMLGEGIGIGLPPVAVSRPVGVLIHFTALAGTSYERRVIESLEAQGWAVVHIETRTRVDQPNLGAVIEAYARREERRRQLLRSSPAWVREERNGRWVRYIGDMDRYAADFIKATRQVEQEIPLPPSGFEPASGSDEDVDDAARRIAAAVDEVLAENAYAAEAALEYLDRRRPDLAGLPVAVIGFSAGALAAPTAAARLGERVSGVVLIGGGADIFRISQRNSLTRGGIELRGENGPLDRRVIERIGERYLGHSRLDPYHTAPMLRGVPVLVVHAMFDGIVPAETGEVLYQRLGRPDRLTFLGGHGGLFYLLEGQAERIGGWLKANVAGVGADSDVERVVGGGVGAEPP